MLVRAEERDRGAARGCGTTSIGEVIPDYGFRRRHGAHRAAMKCGRNVDFVRAPGASRINRHIRPVHACRSKGVDGAKRPETMRAESYAMSGSLRRPWIGKVDCVSPRLEADQIARIQLLQARDDGLNRKARRYSNLGRTR